MSRFFRGGDDSSTDSSSDEEELYAGEEEEDQALDGDELEGGRASEDESGEVESDDEGGNRQGASKFLKDFSSESEESDEEVRAKVKSAKDKRLDELESCIKQIENGQKNGDWTLISAEYDKLNRQISRLQGGGRTPKPYIRILAELEDFMNEALAKQKVTPKKMNATQARALNAVKQKIKKTNKEYQSHIDDYRDDKDGFMESDEEDVAPEPKPKKAPKLELEAVPDEADDEGFATVGKGGRALQYTPESIFKHLRAIMESRGKKNTDRQVQIKVMEKLHDIANTPYQKIRVLLTLISARFDLGSGTSNAMPFEHWKAAEKELSALLATLETSHDFVVVENVEEWDDDEKPPTLQPGEKYIKVAGSVVSYVERLDDELVRSLQSIDPHTSEYIERLQDEGALYNIIFRGLLYYEYLRKDDALQIPQDSVNRIVMRRLEHVYFKVRDITI